jgi:hypothetical protein
MVILIDYLFLQPENELLTRPEADDFVRGSANE